MMKKHEVIFDEEMPSVKTASMTLISLCCSVKQAVPVP